MSGAAPFVTQLRSRPGIIRAGTPGSPAVSIRVQVAETWDTVRVDAPTDTPVSTVKSAALRALLGEDDPGGWVVKHRGAEVLNESVSLADAGVVAGSTLLVTSRRRRPVR